jgi:hypothetical protein
VQPEKQSAVGSRNRGGVAPLSNCAPSYEWRTFHN